MGKGHSSILSVLKTLPRVANPGHDGPGGGGVRAAGCGLRGAGCGVRGAGGGFPFLGAPFLPVRTPRKTLREQRKEPLTGETLKTLRLTSHIAVFARHWLAWA